MRAKKLTGLPTTVEVATGKQVEDAMNFEVDVLWIGARTTVNPFSVQEVADALRGADVPVLIKNPINPDLELWTGAVERVAKSRYQTDWFDPSRIFFLWQYGVSQCTYVASCDRNETS